MPKLLIVESAKKAKQIGGYLGKDYIVTACQGHFKDLDKKSMSIDFGNNFSPIYVITKKNILSDLKTKKKKCSEVILATDLDREGESIAQHLADELKLNNPKRIVFNAVDKKSIVNAIKAPSEINKNMVNAQKARRVIDRLYGYTISPLVSKEIGGNLSAGRVQSVALKILTDKEDEIKDFIEKNSNSSYFKVTGLFSKDKNKDYLKCGLFSVSEMPKKECSGKQSNIPVDNDKVKKFLNKCLKSTFTVRSIKSKTSIRNPAPPFETSSMQQEASRKLGMNVSTCMQVAQKLYESGYITYMRTDSLEISDVALEEIKNTVIEKYGKKYHSLNKYQSKSENAQEAHEAIRPTDPSIYSIEDDVDDQKQAKLYKLIWKRTIASQMKPAKIDITQIQIDISKYVESDTNPIYYFQSQIENIVFKGFMKVYIESDDEDFDAEIQTSLDIELPEIGEKIIMNKIEAKQEFMKAPPRYTEASLIAMLKKLEIGRPSTTANIFEIITKRNYATIGNIKGVEKNIVKYEINSKNGKHIMKILEEDMKVIIGNETKKIKPTDLGESVNEYLVKNFPDMVNYKFTANIEKLLDDIYQGKKIWHAVVKEYYDKILPAVEKKKNVASTINDQSKGNLGKLIGKDDDGIEIRLGKSRYGYYIKKIVYDKDVIVRIPPGIAPNKLTVKQAQALFKERETNTIRKFKLTLDGKNIEAHIMKGQYGPYIKVIDGKKISNYKIPKTISPKEITEIQVLDLINVVNQCLPYNRKPISKSGSKTSLKPKPKPKPRSKPKPKTQTKK